MLQGQFPIGQRISLPGHFAEPVVLESVRPLGEGHECRVRLPDGSLEEVVLTREESDLIALREPHPTSAHLVDVLHRVLWLMENSPRKLREFLNEAGPDRERLRILAQALAGAAFSGKSEEDAERLVGTTPAERVALGKLLANWRSVIEDAVVSEAERMDRKRGQKRLID